MKPVSCGAEPFWVTTWVNCTDTASASTPQHAFAGELQRRVSRDLTADARSGGLVGALTPGHGGDEIGDGGEAGRRLGGGAGVEQPVVRAARATTSATACPPNLILQPPPGLLRRGRRRRNGGAASPKRYQYPPQCNEPAGPE